MRTLGEQPERTAAVGWGPRRRWQCGASAESVSASMPEYTKGAFGCGGRKQDERAWWWGKSGARGRRERNARLDTAGNSAMHT
jgi:hypothetical protein